MLKEPKKPESATPCSTSPVSPGHGAGTKTPPRLVYLNREFLPPERALVSVFDRGFIFGDGVYEVIPVFCGKLFRLAQHLARLENSLRAIRLHNPHTSHEWGEIFARLISENEPADQGRRGDQSLYLQVTRGVAPRDHAFPPGITPTVFAYAQPLEYPALEVLGTGVSAVTTQDIRWQRCDIKSIALLANALLRQQAIEQDAAEAILLRDGYVTEGAASNIFIVSHGRIITPPKSRYILPGITRDLTVELARQHDVACIEAPVSEAQLLGADEIWMTSSTKEIMPITRLNGQPVGEGRPGPMHARMFGIYRRYKRAFCEGAVS